MYVFTDQANENTNISDFIVSQLYIASTHQQGTVRTLCTPYLGWSFVDITRQEIDDKNNHQIWK